MFSWIDSFLSGLSGPWAYIVIALFVFAEDAIFVGFVIPGETAAVIGGVLASGAIVHAGHVDLYTMIGVVILAAIIGDSVGYEVGARYGNRLLAWHPIAKHRHKLGQAEHLLRTRGGVAVFLGRWVAFFRAVMPALAGTVKMPYRTFLPWNALGGFAWGTTFVLIGYFAGNSYKKIETYVGRGAAIAVAAIVIAGLIFLAVRRRRKEAAEERAEDIADEIMGDDANPDGVTDKSDD
jgi:membrane protein DedA with SNARE-associated domain